MIKMKIIFLICLTFCLLISCEKEKSQRELKTVEINAKSDDIFNTAKILANDSGFKVNLDSVKKEYEKIKIDSAELGLQYATRFKDYTMALQFKKIDANIVKDKINQKKTELENREWNNSKAGKLQIKHPNWTKEECISIIKKQVWIGMSYEMLVYQRGKPNSINPSNYGSGIHYQYCWEDYTPSCFYSEENQIITSYN
jgi:hypothetical protein